MDGMAMEKYWDPILQCRTFAWLITVCGCAAILLLADHNSPFTINMNAVSSASVSSRGRSAPWSLSSCNWDVHINCFMSIGALDFEMDHSIIERESGEKKNSKEQYHQYLFQTKSRSGRCLVFSINDGVSCVYLAMWDVVVVVMGDHYLRLAIVIPRGLHKGEDSVRTLATFVTARPQWSRGGGWRERESSDLETGGTTGVSGSFFLLWHVNNTVSKFLSYVLLFFHLFCLIFAAHSIRI